MSARDELARVLYESGYSYLQGGNPTWETAGELRRTAYRQADAALSEWLPTLADDEALVERLSEPKMPPINDSWLWQRVRDGVRSDLRALAATVTPSPPPEEATVPPSA